MTEQDPVKRVHLDCMLSIVEAVIDHITVMSTEYEDDLSYWLDQYEDLYRKLHRGLI